MARVDHKKIRQLIAQKQKTVTDAARPADMPLPGYRKVTPMVFCGIYPADGADYPDLKDALEKLRLNDASLSFDAETSVALGFGFRCGFLGLLHLEIIIERLEREFDLDLITTAPSVVYHVVKHDGTELYIDNPTNLPDPADIEYMEEPMVSAQIFSPSEYVGTIMELCQQRRGTMLHMEYITPTRVQLHYDMPLNDKLFIAQSKTIQNVAEKGPCVIVGRCADYVLRNKFNVLNVFIHSDMESKVRRVVEDYGVESDNVVELINKTDKRRANYYNYYTGMKWGQAENYHLALRTDCIGIDGAVETLIRFIEAKNAEMEKEAAEAK